MPRTKKPNGDLGRGLAAEVQKLNGRLNRAVADRSRAGQARALARAYRLYVRFNRLPESEKQRTLVLLTADEQPSRGDLDPKRVLLRKVVRYSGTSGAARVALSRDVKVLSYAERMKVEPKLFASKLLKKGGGVERWAKHERERRAASSTVSLGKRPSRKPRTTDGSVVAKTDDRERKISFRKPVRERIRAADGTYVLIAIVTGGGAKVRIREAARLSAETLGDAHISDALDHAARWVRAPHQFPQP